MPGPVRLIVLAAATGFSIAPANAQSCADRIDSKKPIDPIIACLKALAEENADLRGKVAALAEKPGTPGQQGEKGDKGDPGEKGEPGAAAINEEIPSGAVVAFAAECPTALGWSPYTDAYGRVIVGAIPNNRDKPVEMTHEVDDFRDYFLRIKRGEERVTLNTDEMPQHTHELQAIIGARPGNPIGDDQFEVVRNRFGTTTQAAPSERPKITETYEKGGNKAHNNMPPYIALYYCRKN